MSTELTLLRHGAVDGRPRVFRGRCDPPLSAEGWAQMREIALALRGEAVSAVLTSPLRRCREPAAMLAERLAARLHVIDDLREMEFGQWEELSPEEVAARWPETLEAFYTEPDRVTPPGGEAFSRFRERVVKAFEHFVAPAGPGHAVIVTHGGVIRVLLSHLLRLDFGQTLCMELATATRCVLSVETDGSCVLRALLPLDLRTSRSQGVTRPSPP